MVRKRYLNWSVTGWQIFRECDAISLMRLYNVKQAGVRHLLSGCQEVLAVLMEQTHKKINSYVCENKGADQLCSNCTADQHFCFRFTEDT